ncbi:hypothetical protein PROFUN_12026 [Planoprotostelium fungivorum]|uniref:Uncharacterized protein n=1 Tax=Planoprotostelium fungivorum TaxID=1890364 RepID=A0A2P6MRE6_9EUKA|nr:hypothetical protein PROFUN_12026 [Planoprotostelium fungivorum]
MTSLTNWKSRRNLREISATKKHIQCTFIEKELLGFLWLEIILYKQRLIELFGSYVVTIHHRYKFETSSWGWALNNPFLLHNTIRHNIVSLIQRISFYASSWIMDLQRRTCLGDCFGSVSVLTSRCGQDKGVSCLILSLTNLQDETETKQTNLVLDCLKTVLALFFLFSRDTRNEPFARHTPE